MAQRVPFLLSLILGCSGNGSDTSEMTGGGNGTTGGGPDGGGSTGDGQSGGDGSSSEGGSDAESSNGSMTTGTTSGVVTATGDTTGDTGSSGGSSTSATAGTTSGGGTGGGPPLCPESPDDYCGCTGVVPAFPGAQGGGAESVGGRGGDILEVTTLADGGPGSLRAALSVSGPRIVVFRVAGTIELDSALSITNPYITVAGQTAPGGGVLISGVDIDSMPLYVGTNDVVLRYLKIRTGRGDSYNYGAGDVISMGEGSDTHDVVIDHCSLSWGNDENVALWSDSGIARNVTVSNSIVSEGLHHDDHSTGLIVGSNTICEQIRDISVHHNLFAHNNNRNPYTKVATQEVINNIVYNWGWLATQIAGGVEVDIIGNLYKEGSDSEGRSEIAWRSDHQGCNEGPSGPPSIHLAGNVGPHNADPAADHWDTMMERTQGWSWPNGMLSRVDRSYQRAQPMSGPPCPVTVHDVGELEDLMLSDVGASHRLDEDGNWVPNRDSVDARIIDEYRTGTGEIILTEDDVGGFPTIAGGAPYADDDHDGMADAWEQAHGFDPASAADGPADRDGDGFTNVEEFLNGSRP